MREHLVSIDIDDPAAIFAERQGEARISEDELAIMTPEESARFSTAIKAYVEAHPKLDVVTLIHRGVTDELVIRWQWRS